MILAAIFGGGRAKATSQPCVFLRHARRPGADPGASGAEKTSTARWPRNWPTSRRWNGSCAAFASNGELEPRDGRATLQRGCGRIGADCWHRRRGKWKRRFSAEVVERTERPPPPVPPHADRAGADRAAIAGRAIGCRGRVGRRWRRGCGRGLAVAARLAERPQPARRGRRGSRGASSWPASWKRAIFAGAN